MSRTIKHPEVIELPLDEAIELEAKQNRERDERTLQEDFEDVGMSVYREEAKHLLETTGEGYLPEYADHKHVKLKK